MLHKCNLTSKGKDNKRALDTFLRTGRYSDLRPKHKRNQPCYCGSGKKYKLCCYRR